MKNLRFEAYYLLSMLIFIANAFAFELQVLAEKLPELLDFPMDLMSLEAASRVYLGVLQFCLFTQFISCLNKNLVCRYN